MIRRHNRLTTGPVQRGLPHVESNACKTTSATRAAANDAGLVWGECGWGSKDAEELQHRTAALRTFAAAVFFQLNVLRGLSSYCLRPPSCGCIYFNLSLPLFYENALLPTILARANKNIFCLIGHVEYLVFSSPSTDLTYVPSQPPTKCSNAEEHLRDGGRW